MKVLELYSGSKAGDSVFTQLGFEIVSCKLDVFDNSLYPRASNRFDLIYININNRDLGFIDGIDYDDYLYGLDLIEYYNPKYWIIQNNNIDVRDDLCMWGLPFRDIKILRGGKINNTRVWNNIFKWNPYPNKTYIKESFILSELLGYI